jgi:peptidyl-prolyl cis-trans isomerase C
MGIAGKLISTMAVIAAFSSPSFSEDAPTIETVVVTVNGTDITLGHVLSLASRLPDQYLGIADKDLYAGIVDQLVQQQLLSSLITEESTELRLAGENEKRALFATDAIESIYSDALTEDAIKAKYETLYSNATPIQEYNASHILVKTEDEAKELAKLLADGGDFVELAKEKSTGPSGPQGGDLGWVGLGQFVPEFEAVMVKLNIGQISEPVKTQFGWHVIKLDEMRVKPIPKLEEVQSEIEEELRSAALAKRVSELETSAQIDRKEGEIDPSIVKKFELLQE